MNWFKILLLPRGLVIIALYTIFIAIPKAVFQQFGFGTQPKSWGIRLSVYAQVVRFVMHTSDINTVKHIWSLYDMVERFRLSLMGFRIEQIKRLDVNGTWIIQQNDYIPDVGSTDWNDRLVCFWIHGGGFSFGSPLSLSTGHCQVINQFNRLTDNKQPLVYFALEYPLAPDAKYPTQLQVALRAYYWLVNQVGVKNIVLGGDSAGGNLALLLYTKLQKDFENNPALVMPTSITLISPWLDLSLSHTPPDIIEHLASSSDYVPLAMLEAWRDNITPSGMNPRDPRISPFFDLNPLVLPRDGVLLIYGGTEIFAPVLDDWVTSLRKDKDSKVKLRVILLTGCSWY